MTTASTSGPPASVAPRGGGGDPGEVRLRHREPPRLRFGIGAGRVELETADVAETTVEVEAIRGNVEDLKVEQHSRDIVIEGRKRFGFKGDEYDIRVRTPYGSEVDANIASATFRAAGRLGAVEVNTASGDVQVEDVERNAKVRSASGDVQLGSSGADRT